MANKYYPDVSDDPDCARKFREANEAYNWLKILSSVQSTILTMVVKFSEDDTYSNSLDHIILNLINSLNNPSGFKLYQSAGFGFNFQAPITPKSKFLYFLW